MHRGFFILCVLAISPFSCRAFLADTFLFTKQLLIVLLYIFRHRHLADAWPQVFDDSEARHDWNWKPKYDLDKLVDLMVNDVRDNYINKGK